MCWRRMQACHHQQMLYFLGKSYENSSYSDIQACIPQDSWEKADLVLLDFSKAFDKVNHLKLLYKLSCFGVKGNTLNWIQSFLIGCTQTVVLVGESSNEVPVTSGVPQGFVLGPLLFLLYINDLPENIKFQVSLFADATAVYLTISNLQDSQVLQFDLESLQRWERTWDMEFNPSKCQVLHIARSKNPVMSSYLVHNQKLESVDAAKYLGVSISKDLSWTTHISKITTCANRTLGFVKRNVVTKMKKSKLWHIFHLSDHSSNLPQQSGALTQKKNISKIEKVQRRAARWVSNDYSIYRSVTDTLSNLGWRSLENRRIDARASPGFTRLFTAWLPYRFRHILYSLKCTLVTCTLYITDKFTHLSVTTSIHCSPCRLFFGTSCQLILSLLLILTPLKQESARSIM